MTNAQLTEALRAAAVERDPYDITQRTPWRERVVKVLPFTRLVSSKLEWFALPWMPHGMVRR